MKERKEHSTSGDATEIAEESKEDAESAGFPCNVEGYPSTTVDPTEGKRDQHKQVRKVPVSYR